jgi:biotin synthase
MLTLDTTIRHDWTRSQIESLFDLPFADLMFQAQGVHRRFHDPNRVQKSQLLSIKTGGCAENCGYCSQSAAFKTGLKAEKLMTVDAVLEAARTAKAGGAERFCMGAAWRSPKDKDIPALAAMVRDVKALGLETCMTLGMLSQYQADALCCDPRVFLQMRVESGPQEGPDHEAIEVYGRADHRRFA